MAKSETVKRMRVLGALARNGNATDEQVAELAALEGAFYSLAATAESVYDLPIARRMWKHDARRVEAR